MQPRREPVPHHLGLRLQRISDARSAGELNVRMPRSVPTRCRKAFSRPSAGSVSSVILGGHGSSSSKQNTSRGLPSRTASSYSSSVIDRPCGLFSVGT